MFLNAINTINTEDRSILLTFDDGPNEFTNNVLDILLNQNVKAVFFCIGSRVKKYPEIVKRIIDEGHVVGNHTYSHTPFVGFWSAKKFRKELELTDSAIEYVSRKKVSLYRPPFGVTNPIMTKVFKGSKYKVMGWSIRSMDTVTKNKTKLLNRILKRLKPGAILLMHEAAPVTVITLPSLLQAIKKQGYDFIDIQKKNIEKTDA